MKTNNRNQQDMRNASARRTSSSSTRETAATKWQLRPIGLIRSSLKDRKDAPRQGSEGAPDAWLEVRTWAAKALRQLSVGDQVIVITWLHRADRHTLEVHPRRPENPLTGVFATRSPDRPNPLGLHEVVIRAKRGTRLRIGPIEAIDKTPVVDIKPVLTCVPLATRGYRR